MCKFYLMQLFLVLVWLFTFGYISVGISYGDEYVFLVAGWGGDEMLECEMALVKDHE